MNTTAAPRAPGLVRATLTLLAGGALAQAVPLLLGPLLTRLYTPQEFGGYHLFAAVAANVAVVACARYEFALPLETSDTRAADLRALCRWLLLAATLASTLGAAAWAWTTQAAWPLWLPLSVCVLGAVSLATLDATREQRFHALASARVAQHGGGAALQAAAGVLHAGVTGLIAAPLLAAAAALAVLRWRWRGGWRRPWTQLRAVAAAHRQFPLLNTPHAFAGALQDTAAVALIAAWQGPAAAGFWGLTLRYLKAPATLVGGAVSQALYPKLAQSGHRVTAASRAAAVRVMATLGAIAAVLVLLLAVFGPWAFAHAFGDQWREAGELARALAPYIALHFVASPLAVVTMAWRAQGWALRLALVGQALFVGALALGLAIGGLQMAGWMVSGVMVLYFGWYFWKLATWPLDPPLELPA
ncbi:lipopolysaccharide biosynthesis protein [Ideonella sp. BN130291]|uniref:lipopolysaccharide biosynthesis protein n=1 Tax=Ideonella sp. BN130291 TaxID=3112940 RepID=UPI002E25D075|nr:oligosaccharide flippase family protein [Ideonella sp. BN130291]